MSEQPTNDQPAFDRRDFLKLGGTAGAGFLAGSVAVPGEAAPVTNSAATALMPTRNLGRTGHKVGIFSLGGQASVEQPNNAEIAVPIVEKAIDLGVNYIDTAAAYGGAERWSQRYIGEVMKRRRREVFLASKTNDRTRDGSLRLLEESLRLLNTDHLDLWQVHNVARMDQIEEIFRPGGAIEALRKAKDEKTVRFLGITGHADPEVLLEGLRRFEFDTILLALNAADPHHLSFETSLLPLAVEKQLGIIGMKIPARGRLMKSWTPPPLDQQREVERPATPGTLDMREAMYYTLSLPVSTVIIGCDTIAHVEENVKLAREFTPLSAAQMAAIAKKAEPVTKQALFFRRWT
jgi:predicted aldo/keto reductase-like oxidoreductase